jgi:hypothetical protein
MSAKVPSLPSPMPKKPKQTNLAMTDKQMLELLEAVRLKESPDQLCFDLFAGNLTLSDDGCGQLLLFG